MANDESEQPGQSAEAPKTQKRKRVRRDDSDLQPGHTWDRFPGARMRPRFRGGDGVHTNGASDQRATERAERGR